MLQINHYNSGPLNRSLVAPNSNTDDTQRLGIDVRKHAPCKYDDNSARQPTIVFADSDTAPLSPDPDQKGVFGCILLIIFYVLTTFYILERVFK
jgi:hypothetical protein